MDRTTRISTFVLLLAAGLWAAARPVSSGDLWVALGCGRYHLAHGIGRTDPFSFTSVPGHWVNQNWLSHVWFTVVHGALGWTGLGLWKLAVCAAICGLTASTARALGASRALGAGAGIAVALAGRPFFDIRPNLHTILLAAVLARWIAGAGLDAWKRIVPVVGLLVLWANLHGGFLFGVLAICAAAAVDFVLAGRATAQARRGMLLLLPVLAILAPLVSPFGLANWTHPYQVSAGPEAAHWREVAEWRPPFGEGALDDPAVRVFWSLFALAVVTAFLLVPRSRRPAFPPARLRMAAVGALALVLALTSRRFVPLFAVTALPLAAASLSAWKVRARVPSPAWPVAALLLLFVTGIDGARRLVAPNALWPRRVSWAERLVRADEQPRAAVDFLLASGTGGRLLNDWTWGGYLLARAPFEADAPRYRIFIDGRAQAAYPASVSRDWVALQEAAAARDRDAIGSFLEAYAIDICLLDRRGAGLALLIPELPGWTAVYGDDQAVVAVRLLTEPIAETPIPDRAVAEASLALRIRTSADESLDQEGMIEAFAHASASVTERPTTVGLSEMARLALLAPEPLRSTLLARASAACEAALQATGRPPDATPYDAAVLDANAAQARAVLARISGDAATESRMRERARASAERADRLARRLLR